MKTLYVAAQDRDYAAEVAVRLAKAGHIITSRWVWTTGDMRTKMLPIAERRRLAVMDEEDVKRAVDGLVLLSDPRGLCPGGKHVETGMALALGRSVYVVGQEENLFHWHPLVRVFSGVNELIKELNAVEAHTD